MDWFLYDRTSVMKELIRLKQFLNFKARKVLITSYIFSNFTYCPLVWMFSTAKLQNEIGSANKSYLFPF